MTDILYKIQAGRVSTRTIPAEGVTLPVFRREDFRQPVAVSGLQPGEWDAWTLARVTDIANRMTPWAAWWCSPGKQGVSATGGKTYGIAHIRQSAVWLSTAESATTAIQTALHEAMHVAEDWLTLAEMQSPAAGTPDAIALPDGVWNDYYCKPIEVRANAFASWPYSYFLRGRMPEYRRGMPADERVWTMIYRGDLAVRVARRGLIPADRLPDAPRVRLGERSVDMLAWDYGCRAVSGALAKPTVAAPKVRNGGPA